MKQEDLKNVATQGKVEPTQDRRVLTPFTDILESEAGFELRLDLPGADPSTIDVTFEKDVLTLRAGIRPLDREGFQTTLSEFDLADYERRFQVTENVDPNAIEADYKLGVLRIRVPKTKPARRRIEVSAS